MRAEAWDEKRKRPMAYKDGKTRVDAWSVVRHAFDAEREKEMFGLEGSRASTHSPDGSPGAWKA